MDDGFLLDHMGTGGFVLLGMGCEVPEVLHAKGTTVTGVSILEPGVDLRARYLGAAPQAVYLIRPDQHISARWPTLDETAVHAAVDRALGRAS